MARTARRWCPAGLRRLARLVEQRLGEGNVVVDVGRREADHRSLARRPHAMAIWQLRKRSIAGPGLRGHVVASTGAGSSAAHPASRASRRRVCGGGSTPRKEHEAAEAARAARTPEEVEQERQRLERYSVLFIGKSATADGAPDSDPSAPRDQGQGRSRAAGTAGSRPW